MRWVLHTVDSRNVEEVEDGNTNKKVNGSRKSKISSPTRNTITKRSDSEGMRVFCSKSKDQVRLLITGPSVYICNECSVLAAEILIQHGIELNIQGVPRVINVEAMGIKPFFRKVRFEQRPDHCFYLCPLKDPFDTIYKDHVVRAARVAGFTVERADEIFGTQPIIEDIWEAINSALLFSVMLRAAIPMSCTKLAWHTPLESQWS